jgi:hypothetical protein
MSISVLATLGGVRLPAIELPYIPGEQGTDIRNRIHEAFNSSVRHMIHQGAVLQDSASAEHDVDPLSPIFAALAPIPADH